MKYDEEIVCTSKLVKNDRLKRFISKATKRYSDEFSRTYLQWEVVLKAPTRPLVIGD